MGDESDDAPDDDGDAFEGGHDDGLCQEFLSAEKGKHGSNRSSQVSRFRLRRCESFATRAAVDEGLSYFRENQTGFQFKF